MRRLLSSILILGAFLGGYYLGGQEGSPDIFAWARRAYPRFAEAGRNLVDSVTARAAADEPPRDEEAPWEPER
jgi:hypothetical protein